MNISKRWLRDMVPGLTGDAAEIAEHLALRGAPVEGIESPGAELGDVVIGRVVSAGPHPNADRLSLCEVDGGDGIVRVVCGAPNVEAGTCYPFAPVGAVLPGAGTSIVSSSMYGTWKVEAFLDGSEKRCSSPTKFVIQP